MFIVDDNEGESKLGVTLTLDGGAISGKAEPGYETLLETVLAYSHMLPDGTVVTASSDPKAWIEAMPINYRGSYVSAELDA